MVVLGNANAITGHPAVKNSKSNAAIGVLCVKKTIEGVNFYFAHNTDSFVRWCSFRHTCIFF